MVFIKFLTMKKVEFLDKKKPLSNLGYLSGTEDIGEYEELCKPFLIFSFSV